MNNGQPYSFIVEDSGAKVIFFLKTNEKDGYFFNNVTLKSGEIMDGGVNNG